MINLFLHIKKALPVLLLILFSCFFAFGDNSPINHLKRRSASSPILFTSSTLYGPYKGGEEITFKWSYRNVSGTNYSSVNDYFIVSCPSYSSSPLLSKRVSKHSLAIGAKQNLSYSYKIPPQRFNTESGLVIKVGVQYGGSYLSIIEKTIKPISSKTINPLDYRSSPYVIKDRSFYLKDVEVNESFLFDEYRDYVECDQYNRLLLSNLTFRYNYPLKLLYKNARVKFLDPENIFSSLSLDGDGYRSINIVLDDQDGIVKILIPSIYYDPLSLVPNDKGKGNKTKYLYVPKGKSKKIEKYEFIIEATGLGINKTSFSHCLELSISPFFLGDCIDSDYCIVGGVKK
ncbi:MAG: hypothetical protein E7181_00325 [Erysipelotrichaceae bacterium]|nr:hypothetical protein [Erysipelotrichaceae bacterium]